MGNANRERSPEIKANRPDIFLKNETEKKILIDMSIPTERNTSVKETENPLSKYKDIQIEIERMWGMKAKTISVVIRGLGLIKKG